jgi:CheY-like chemotaxis protein
MATNHHPPGPSDTEAKPAGPPRRSAGHNQLVLVVDDHRAVLDAVRLLLECRGYQVLAASCGAEAVKICRGRPGEILAVVTDLMMPGMNGLATIGALRELEPDLPFIGISGTVDSNKIREFSALGLVALLHKPFSMEEMMEALTQAFQQRARASAPNP